MPLVACTATTRSTPATLPIRYAGISPCFRREAGAHGKDTRGLYRVHQFTKVEQVVFCVPDEAVAEKEHYELLGNAEAILAKLEIPYRVAHRVHRRDRPRADAQARGRVVDAGRAKRLQRDALVLDARRLPGAPLEHPRAPAPTARSAYPYTLNNTAIASPRILIPLLENHQNADGSVTLPKALVPYMLGKERLSPAA